MYEIDRYAIEEKGIQGKILMENAGAQVAKAMIHDHGKRSKAAIVVGSGNNGGDGFVIARYLQEFGCEVTVFQIVADHKIAGDAAYHKQLWLQAGGALTQIKEAADLKERLALFDIVVDAILGIGVKGNLREPIRSMINAINQLSVKTIAVDIPSGLPAADDHSVDIAVEADYTYIIDAPKQSLFCEGMTCYYGSWQVLPIGIPSQAYAAIQRGLWRQRDVQASLPRREVFSHKGSHGKGAVIGGQLTMPGSICLSAKAALRSGAGLVTVATLRENIVIVTNQCVEATYHVLPDFTAPLSESSLHTLASYDAIAVGMGMGREPSELVQALLQDTDVPLLIDADGLYQLKPLLAKGWNRMAPVVITPHYGEMAMLTGQDVASLKQAPFSISQQFAARYQVYVVLKGKYTIITSPNGQQMVSDQGNAGLAKGGTGDVLSGILLTMLMQHDEVMPALANGCYVHGRAAEILVERQHTTTDLLASDVIEGLSQVFRTLT